MAVSKMGIWNMALVKIGESQLIESEDEDGPAAEICRLYYDTLLREVLEARTWKWALRERIITNIDEQSVAYDGDDATLDFQIPYAFRDTEQLEVVLTSAAGVDTTLEAATDYTLTLAADGAAAYITMIIAPGTGETLTITVTTSRVGWNHVYAVPSDCVTPLAFLYQGLRMALIGRDASVDFAVVDNDAGDGSLICCDLDETEFDKLEYVGVIDYPPKMPALFVEALSWRLAIPLALGIRKDKPLAASCRVDYKNALDEAHVYTQNVDRNATDDVTPSVRARG